MVRPHDGLKGTVAERVFICAGELANHLRDARKDRSPFAPIDQRVGMCNIARAAWRFDLSPLRSLKTPASRGLGTSARPHPR